MPNRRAACTTASSNGSHSKAWSAFWATNTPMGPCVGRNRAADSTAALIDSARRAWAASRGVGVAGSAGSRRCVMLAIDGRGRREYRTTLPPAYREAGNGTASSRFSSLAMPKAALAREWLAAACIASSGMWETSIRPAAGSGVRTLPSSHRRPFDAPNAFGHRLGFAGEEPAYFRRRSVEPPRQRHCGAAASVKTSTSSPVVGLMS